MKSTKTQATITISLADLEAMMRRVVREELARLLRAPSRDILNDWSQEGPEDLEGDEHLLRDALELIKRYGENPVGWKTLEEFEAELAQAEAAHELPS
jgi:hypothetical protein